MPMPFLWLCGNKHVIAIVMRMNVDLMTVYMSHVITMHMYRIRDKMIINDTVVVHSADVILAFLRANVVDLNCVTNNYV